MEKKLNKTELKELLAFIEHKGYTFVDVQLEILDHFACKVEELMTENPTLNLQGAMVQAHQSFGAMGFSEIEDSFDLGLQNKFVKSLPGDFWIFMKSWRSAVYILYFTLFAYFIPFTANPFWDGIRMGLVASIIIFVPVLLLKYRPIYNKYKLYRSYIGMMIPMFTIFVLLISGEWLSKYIPLALYNILILVFIYVALGILDIFHRNLKLIVKRVDEMELETHYS